MDENEGPDGTDGRSAEQMKGMAKRAFLAWIGAMATAYDTAERQFGDFVRRGQEVRDEWKDRAEELQDQNRTASARARDSFRGFMDGMLDSMNIPSKTEVDAMNVKLNLLLRKLDDLTMGTPVVARPGQPEAPSPIGEPPPPDTDLAT